MGEKKFNQQREKKKRRVQKIICSSCKAKIIVEEEIDNGNYTEFNGIKFIECQCCGLEIII